MFLYKKKWLWKCEHVCLDVFICKGMPSPGKPQQLFNHITQSWPVVSHFILKRVLGELNPMTVPRPDTVIQFPTLDFTSVNLTLAKRKKRTKAKWFSYWQFMAFFIETQNVKGIFLILNNTIEKKECIEKVLPCCIFC